MRKHFFAYARALLIIFALLDSFWMLDTEPAHAETVIRGPQTMSRLTAANDVRLESTTIRGNVVVGGSVRGNKATVLGKVTAGDDAEFEQSRINRGMTVGGNIVLKQTQASGALKAGQKLTLENSKPAGPLTAGQEVNLIKTNATTEVSVASPELYLEGSKVKSIRMRKIHQVGQVSWGNGGVVVNGSVRNAVIGNNQVFMNNNNSTVSGSGSLVSIGPGSVSQVNGFTIRATENATTVMTPDNAVYTNGKNVSGGGSPETYEDYRRQNPQAPLVHGPGWNDSTAAGSSGNNSTVDDTPVSSAAATGPQQRVMLRHGSVVTGDIVFEQGNGSVWIDQTSRHEGKIIGGARQEDVNFTD